MLGRGMGRAAPSFVPLLLFALWSCSSPGRVSSTDSGPACPGLRAPVILGESTTLSFCDTVTGVSCCDADEDESLREEFEAMKNVARDAACTTIVKGILCARCILSSSPMPSFNTPPAGSTTTAESIPPQCAVPPVAATSSSSSQQDGDAMCVERIGEGSYLHMVAHPDGSGRAFLSTQDGKIWLATIPVHGSGGTLQIPDNLEASRPFLDLTERVLGLMGVAFHPEFAANRRFFVSYTCDTTASPECVGSAGTTTAGNGSTTSSSQYQLVVAEFSAKSKATRADLTEVRRIFTMDLPTSSHAYQQQQPNGGQILFRPSDGYLYLMTGNGGDDEANHGEFSSNTTTASFLGKIVRFNIDGSTYGQSGGGASNRTANRSGTTTTTATAEPEIFATGLGNPRGCSFDSARPLYLFCASVDEQQYESVHLIGGPSANAAFLVVGYGRPVSGTPSILGGYVYRGSADPSLEGRYLYMYGASAWAAVEAPASSGRYVSAQIPNIMCSGSSPAPCTAGGGVHGRVVSFGEDNSNDAFVLATGGVYRVVAPSFCRARSSRSSAASGLPWMLSVGACALASAFYVCWKVFASDRRPVMSCNGWLFRCFACIVCPCCNCCNNVMNIHHGPAGAGSDEAGLELGSGY